MTKKRAKPKPRRKKASRKPDLTLQFIKIASGLAVLVLFVVGAGFIANHYFRSSAPAVTHVPPAPDSGKSVAAMTRPKPTPVTPVPEKPVYEVFPKTRPQAEPPPRPPMVAPVRPPLVAIIIDDIGYDRGMAHRFLQLGIPLTFSMLPYGPFNRTILADARANGVEIMLHLPMEPNEYPHIKPGPGALLQSMSPDALIAQLETNLDQFQGISGVNNHMGSRLSTSPEHMRQIFSILKKRGLFYIDSRTTPHSVAHASAQLLQLPFAERDIFIDHLDNPAFIRSQMRRLIQRAEKQGHAIGIAHPHDHTFQVLKEFLPELEEKVTLVSASTIVTHVMAVETTDNSAAMAKP